jgi:hypothetical protein
MDKYELENRFLYHAPTGNKAKSHERIRNYVGQMAQEFNVGLPEGREKDLAITKLEEAMMWANAAIARNPEE